MKLTLFTLIFILGILFHSSLLWAAGKKGGLEVGLDLMGKLRTFDFFYDADLTGYTTNGCNSNTCKESMDHGQFVYSFFLNRQTEKKSDYFFDWELRADLERFYASYHNKHENVYDDKPLENVNLSMYNLNIKPGITFGFLMKKGILLSKGSGPPTPVIFSIGPLLTGFYGRASINDQRKASQVTNFAYGYWYEMGAKMASMSTSWLGTYFIFLVEYLKFDKDRFFPNKVGPMYNFKTESHALGIGLRIRIE